MAEPFRCPHGHYWAASTDALCIDSPTSVLCPYCGAAAETLITDRPPGQGGTLEEHLDPSAVGTGIYQPTVKEHNEPALVAVPKEIPVERGRFTKLQLHARGGLGKVSLARDEDIGRTVALKEIRGRFAEDPQCRQRFINEAEITGQLEHPGIVPVYSLGRDSRARPYYAMKFVHGRTLADAIAEYHSARAPLALRELLLRFIDVCQAVGYAHSKGVIHRDLKPANVMLGEYGETLVLDWGLAKRLTTTAESRAEPAQAIPLATAQFLSASERAELPSTNLTQAGTVLGTPAYMSPEQAAGETQQIGPASDIYALGAILYEILAGCIPYEAQTTEAMLTQICQGTLERPSHRNRRVPRPLESICLKALARRPAERYDSATDLAQDLECWLADEPVSVHPDSFGTRLLRWERRHKPLVAGSAALLLTAAVLAVVFVLIHDRLISEEQQRTEIAKQRAEENFRDARDAVEEMLAKVGEERLANVPGMDPVRRQLLEKALAFYEKFSARHSDHPEVQLDMARALRRVGAIRSLLGETDKARDALSQSLGLFAQLRRQGQFNPAFRRELALVEHDLAWLLHRQTSQPRDGELHYREALRLQEELAAESPSEPAYRQELARTWHDFGLLHQITGHPAPAEEALREALRLRRQLASPLGGPEHLRELAQTQNDLGQLLQQQTRGSEAEKSFREAITLQQQAIERLPQEAEHLHEVPDAEMEMVAFRNNLALLLTASDPSRALEEYRLAESISERLLPQFPDRSDYRQKLARTHLNAGQLHTDRKDWDQARAAFLRALAEYQRLADARQGGPDCQSELGLTLNNLALVAYHQHTREEARQLLTRAVQHQRGAWRANPKHPSYRQRLRDSYQGLAFVQLELHDHAGAATSAREPIASVPAGWDTYHRAAGYLAACAALAGMDKQQPNTELAGVYAEQAVDLLHRAVGAGLNDPRLLQTEAFGALTARTDFQSLLKSLQDKSASPDG